MSAPPAIADHRPMPSPQCALKLILVLPSRVLDVVLGPQEQIAYVSVTR
jgi:hypothetical protein